MRVHDWPTRLGAAMASGARTPFVYGENDCCLFPMACADAVTGGELVGEWRGLWSSYRGGLVVLKARTGLRSIEAWADSLWPRVPVALAHRGDWAMVAIEPDPGTRATRALTVVDGAVLRSPGGVVLPRSAALLAWRVD